jgi:hypothetical protein
VSRFPLRRDRRAVNVVDSRGESLIAIRDRYEQLRAEVQARRRKHQTVGGIAPAWRRAKALTSSKTPAPSGGGIFVKAVAASR